MATVCGPKPSQEGVSVLLGRLAIEAVGVISDSERRWICNPLDPMLVRSMPDISRSNGWMDSAMASAASVGSIQEASGFRFLCCCPRVVPFRTNGIASRKLAGGGICLQMADLPEHC